MDEKSNDVSPASAEKTSGHLESFWKEIRKSSDEHWTVRGREIGNIIGYCLYPVGWTWEEIPWDENCLTLPYDHRANDIRNIIDLPAAEPLQGAVQCIEAGARHRISQVNKLLLRLIVRREIEIITYNQYENGEPLGDPIRLSSAFCVDVKVKEVGLGDFVAAWRFGTDTERLINAINKMCAWRTRSDSYDHLKVERFLRYLFETKGLPSNKDDYLNAFYSWLNNPDTEPSPNTVRPIISRLFEEYSVT